MATIQGKDRGLLTLAAMQITAGGSAGRNVGHLIQLRQTINLICAHCK